jgi:hypothetical protein
MHLRREGGVRTFNVNAEHVEKFEKFGWRRAGYKLFADAQVSCLMTTTRTILIMPCLACCSPLYEWEYLEGNGRCRVCEEVA